MIKRCTSKRLKASLVFLAIKVEFSNENVITIEERLDGGQKNI